MTADTWPDPERPKRFRDRLSYACRDLPTTPAQARRLAAGGRAGFRMRGGQAHRYVARVARRQLAMRVQRRKYRADCRAGRGVVWGNAP